MTQLAEVFKLNRNGLNLRRAFGVAVVMLVPLNVLAALDQEKCWLMTPAKRRLALPCPPGPR